MCLLRLEKNNNELIEVRLRDRVSKSGISAKRKQIPFRFGPFRFKLNTILLFLLLKICLINFLHFFHRCGLLFNLITCPEISLSTLLLSLTHPISLFTVLVSLCHFSRFNLHLLSFSVSLLTSSLFSQSEVSKSKSNGGNTI